MMVIIIVETFVMKRKLICDNMHFLFNFCEANICFTKKMLECVAPSGVLFSWRGRSAVWTEWSGVTEGAGGGDNIISQFTPISCGNNIVVINL